MAKLKFEVNPGLLHPLGDRFHSAGYKDPINDGQAFDTIAGMQVADGIGFWGPGQVTIKNAKEVAERVRNVGKEPATLVVNYWEKQWGWGSLTNKSADIRKKAIERGQECVEIAKLMGMDIVSVWFGHDGVDYAFQADYSKIWDWLVDGVSQIADYDKNTKVAIEYKIREPRIHEFVGNFGDTMCLINDIGKDNVGMTLDLGHAINAGERIAYSTARALEKGVLYNMHWGDNYRLWDDDVIVGTVNTIEFIEVVYWLHKYDWEGWCGLDQYPFKNNALDAMTESILWVKGFEKLIQKIGMDVLSEVINKDEPKEALRLLREAMLES